MADRPVDIESTLTSTLGTAVLKASDGFVVKATGELVGDTKSTDKLYEMLLDTGTILGDEPLRRITGACFANPCLSLCNISNEHSSPA